MCFSQTLISQKSQERFLQEKIAPTNEGMSDADIEKMDEMIKDLESCK